MLTEFRIEYHTAWGESLEIEAGGVRHPLTWNEGDIWTVRLNCRLQDLKSYRYSVMRDGLEIRSEWDCHSRSKAVKVAEDKWIDCPPGCEFTRKHSVAEFDIPGWRGAGTVIPVFSLRTRDDFGIGDFRDLRPLVDWAAATGQSIIQLLPVTDTTRKGEWKDSYPYSPVSAFALNPMYIRLQDLGIREDREFLRKQRELNALPEIDYPEVFKAKTALMKKAYAGRGAKDLESAQFKRFHKANAGWLDEYAEFCAGRDGDEAGFHQWVQFHLDLQFSEEAAYARSKGVHFKGDLPIGVSAESADARFHPELFNLGFSAGAPPDFFSADGQNWGFPTYNWEAMARDGYDWWKRRLRKMSQYFDAYRIDHILGFFRIWEIPSGEKGGVNGHFNPALSYCPEEIAAAGLPLDGLFHADPHSPGKYQPLISPDTSSLEAWQKDRFAAIHDDFFFHRNNEFWRRNAERKLPSLLGATGMLACGEDLGMVPDCVDGVMAAERILSLEMPMMDKGRGWPRLSVCTSSSHDMQTLRMQQSADPTPEEAAGIISGILNSGSMLAILPLQDWLSMDGTLRRKDRDSERINEPADPNHHWRYRLHFPLEDIPQDFTSKVKEIVSASGRNNNR